ncbi:MAG TPA: site-2 protease family protein [bacterium]
MRNLSDILTLVPGFVFGLTLHEFSHAFVASRLGDPTAQRMGRLTLNPLAHLDLLGSVMLVAAGFGWAKPVPVDVNYLRSPRRDMALIAVAGPVSNIVLATACALLLRLLFMTGLFGDSTVASVALNVMIQAIQINVILAVFNIIPVPPLDGSRIVAGIVPEAWNHGYEQFERFGPLLLLGLVLIGSVTGVSILSRIIMPMASPIYKLVMLDWLFR